MSEKIIQSYVWHGEKRFFISTINRETSSVLAAGHIYAETMVWEWDEKSPERGPLIWQGEDRKDSFHTHILACLNLHDNGSMAESETEDAKP